MTASFRKAILTCAVLGICSAAETNPRPVTKEQVAKWMTEISNWGRWGKDDQRGTLNLITPAKRKQALALVKDGVSISLAHDIDRVKTADSPRPLSAEMTLDAAGHAMDLYTFWYHGSIITHIDALCHYSFEGKLYNGFPRSEITQATGCPKLGVENQKQGYMTRAILVDMPLLKKVPYLEPGTAITQADLEAWEKFAGVKVESGDALFMRTGRWVRRAKLGPWNVAASAAGFDASVMPWLHKRDVALLGNDAVEDAQPSGVEGVGRPIHQLAIVALGLPLIDVMDLEAVAAECERRHKWEFMVTVAPPPVLGGTGFPINPIATF